MEYESDLTDEQVINPIMGGGGQEEVGVVFGLPCGNLVDCIRCRTVRQQSGGP